MPTKTESKRAGAGDRDGDSDSDSGARRKRRQTGDHQHGESAAMREVARAALDDAKGVDIVEIDVRALTDITDAMLIATGGSERHIKTLAERVLERMRAAGWRPLGVEGLDGGDCDWVLADFVDVVVHIMRAPTREKYDLEGLWDENFGALPGTDAGAGGG